MSARTPRFSRRVHSAAGKVLDVSKDKAPASPISTAESRRLAVEASCDPRTIIAVASGREVRGLAGERARQALIKAGYPVPDVTPESE